MRLPTRVGVSSATALSPPVQGTPLGRVAASQAERAKSHAARSAWRITRQAAVGIGAPVEGAKLAFPTHHATLVRGQGARRAVVVPIAAPVSETGAVQVRSPPEAVMPVVRAGRSRLPPLRVGGGAACRRREREVGARERAAGARQRDGAQPTRGT